MYVFVRGQRSECLESIFNREDLYMEIIICGGISGGLSCCELKCTS